MAQPPVPQSVDELAGALREHAYLADRGLATVLHLSMRLEKPLLLEGEAGVGKTELAKVLAEVTGGRLIRLQCYEGIDVAHALYDWSYARQLLYIRTLEAGAARIAFEIFVQNHPAADDGRRRDGEQGNNVSNPHRVTPYRQAPRIRQQLSTLLQVACAHRRPPLFSPVERVFAGAGSRWPRSREMSRAAAIAIIARFSSWGPRMLRSEPQTATAAMTLLWRSRMGAAMPATPSRNSPRFNA